MRRRHAYLAVAALVLIPVTVMLGGRLAIAINPEIAAGHPNYVRNFYLLQTAKHVVMAGTALLACGLWLACCALFLKAKARSFLWLPLAILGPLGLAALAVLADKSDGNAKPEHGPTAWVRHVLRLAFEAAFFIAAWFAAYEAMVAIRDLLIRLELQRTGMPVADIIELQNASSGMWAFGEGLEVMFLLAVLYVLRPIGFNVAKSLAATVAARRAR